MRDENMRLFVAEKKRDASVALKFYEFCECSASFRSTIAVPAFVALINRETRTPIERRRNLAGNFCHVCNETIYVR